MLSSIITVLMTLSLIFIQACGDPVSTYKIKLVAAEDTNVSSSEAEINALVISVSGADQAVSFNANRQATVYYPYGDSTPDSVTLKSIGVSDEATSDYDGGDAISVTDGKAIIVITAQDSTVQTYTIHFFELLVSREADITSLVLSVSGIDKTIDFDANRRAIAYYPYGDSTPDSVRVTSISISVYAVVSAVKDSTIIVTNEPVTIVVIAQDGQTIQTYTINLVQRDEPSLKNILDSAFGGTSTVPADLSGYDELTQVVLAPYTVGADLAARYITIAGGETTQQDGTSWSDAAPASKLKQILDGISDAGSNKVYLILVASSASDSPYDAGESMEMKNHVAIIGGWNAIGGWSRSGNTVLSGGNSHRVFYNESGPSSPLGSTSVLYGLTIASGRSSDAGGGMYNNNSSPTMTNIVFSSNLAGTTGGGIYNNNSSPTMTNIAFYDNSASSGGGMHNNNSSPTMTNISFSANSAVSRGGGMYNFSSSPTLTNITFSDNSADYGGGMHNSQSSLTMTNVTFSDNSADLDGGGMYITDSKASTIVNSIFWGNAANTGGVQIHIDGTTGESITLAYSVIEGVLPANVAITTNLVTTDPSLSDLSTDTGSFVATRAISTGSSAINAGIYVRRSDTDSTTFYYSTDNSNWYSDFTSDTDSTGSLITSVTLPTDSIDITATDATGTARSGRPDAGAYEAR